MRYIYFILSILCTQLNAQDVTFKAEVSTDNIQIDEVFQLTLTIENGNGNFVPPVLEHFEIVGGPNVSSSMKISNGHMEKSESYTYFLKPKYAGEYMVETAYYETDENNLSSSEILIIVGGLDIQKQKRTKQEKHPSKKKIFKQQDIKTI